MGAVSTLAAGPKKYHLFSKQPKGTTRTNPLTPLLAMESNNQQAIFSQSMSPVAMTHQIVPQSLNPNDEAILTAPVERAEIRVLKTTQAQETAALHEHLGKIEEGMAKVPGRLKEVEARILELEDKVESMQQEVIQLEKNQCPIKDKLLDLENYNRWSNLEVIGAQEGSKGLQVS
ncbi:hypothetical protein NDU88_001996 [Pleurodeles waltl]|uniref:Uncharacterized protein n=1 Tax=Pleurodeles waltl TaxID=8319 RepID=A0AAV7TKK5_PLEWA|nr:hypothetical protein NDU88_001996 [Pleurodeles waltl]